MNPLQQLQRQAEIAMAIETIAALALLILFVWSIVWSVKAFNRWERRDEAKLKAIQRIAAHFSNEAPSASANERHDFRATR